jgi:hypothetical protein
MKKLLLAAVALMATMSVNAQQMFLKPMVGGTLATLTGDVDDTKMKVGLVAGAEFGYFISEQFAVTAGLLYAMEGTAIKDVDDNMKLDYLNIPILANYYVAPGFAIKAGIQPGILCSSKYGDYDIKDSYKSLDIAIPIGVSYEISDFVIDARYNLGVANIYDSSHFKEKTSVIMLTLGYKIPF